MPRAFCDPGVPPCEKNCRIRAHELFAGCVDEGEDARVCAQKARAALEECVVANCETCTVRCARLGRQVERRCLAAGESPRVCAARARKATARCTRFHCGEPPSCKQRCTRRAELVRKSCLRAGGNEERCKAQAEHALRECLVRVCDAPPPPDPCPARCELDVVAPPDGDQLMELEFRRCDCPE